MSPFQGLGEGATAFPGLRPGLSYLAPSGHQSDPPAQRSRRRQRTPHASRDGLGLSQQQAVGLSSPLPPPPAPGIEHGVPNGTNLSVKACCTRRYVADRERPLGAVRMRANVVIVLGHVTPRSYAVEVVSRSVWHPPPAFSLPAISCC